MNTFGDDLIQSLGEALAHAKGDGLGIVHEFPDPRQVRQREGLTSSGRVFSVGARFETRLLERCRQPLNHNSAIYSSMVK